MGSEWEPSRSIGGQSSGRAVAPGSFWPKAPEEPSPATKGSDFRMNFATPIQSSEESALCTLAGGEGLGVQVVGAGVTGGAGLCSGGAVCCLQGAHSGASARMRDMSW